MFERLFDFIAPRYCSACGRRLSCKEEIICSVCNWKIPRTKLWEIPYDNHMVRLYWGRINIEKAAAWMYFTPHSLHSEVIYNMKYHKIKEIGMWLGTIMAEEISPSGFFDDIDYIIPVPITWTRRLKRGYNQSEEIANGISKITNIPTASDIVRRKTFRISQTQLNKQERRDNVDDVFTLSKHKEMEGKHLLVVDDITTTGSTTCSIAKELEKINKVKISILTVGFTK